MKYYRAEIVYDEPVGENAVFKGIPKAVRLVDEDSGETIELPNVREVAIRLGMKSHPLVSVELMVTRFSEVVE